MTVLTVKLKLLFGFCLCSILLACAPQQGTGIPVLDRDVVLKTEHKIVWYRDKGSPFPYKSIVLKDLSIDITAQDVYGAVKSENAYLSILAYKNSMQKALSGPFILTRQARPDSMEISATLADQLRDPELILLANQLKVELKPFTQLTLIIQFRDANTGKLLAALGTNEYAHILQAQLFNPQSVERIEQAYAPIAQGIAGALIDRKNIYSLHH